MSAENNEQEPSGITNTQLGGQKGLLSAIGDPVGNALNKGLSPAGGLLGGLTQSVNGGESTDLVKGASQALGITKSEEQRKQEAESERIGGKEQSADNPLGL